MDLKITPSGQTIVKPTALGPVVNTDTKLLICGLFKRAEFWHRTRSMNSTRMIWPVSRTTENSPVSAHVLYIECMAFHRLQPPNR